MQLLLSSLLFPQQNVCHVCGRALEYAGLLCPACERRTHGCLLPENQRASDAISELDGCLSVFAYRDTPKHLVHLLKYQTDTAMAAWLGERMAASVLARPFFACADVVIPVPLHAQRLEQRGYNQSLLLSQELCSHTGQPLLVDGLIRSRNTGTQVGRTREERLHALRGAFAVSSPSAVNGKRILLVDDVLTTGATAIACAEALWWTGAVSVSLVTACRAQRD